MKITKKVMIIEDDEDVLFIMSLILKDNGFEVVESRSVDIISQLSSFQPDLILMDNYIQGASGSDMCKKLKSDPSTSHYCVVLISASSELPAIAEECFADGFVEKPFDLTDFVKKLRGFTAG